MVAPEVLKELQPFVGLAEGLGRTAVQLVEESGFADVAITYVRWGPGKGRPCSPHCLLKLVWAGADPFRALAHHDMPKSGRL